jgi:DNA-binding transcriptional ArsR family regulator
MDRLLQALATPRRREILRIVRKRERSAGDIHRALGDLTFGAVSQHLGVLEDVGLVSVRKEGRSRIYAARVEGLRPLREWLDSMWEDALERLARLAEAEAGAGEARDSQRGRKRRPPSPGTPRGAGRRSRR